MTGYAPRAYGDAQPRRASEIQAGDRVSLGNHTGWLRVRRIATDDDRVIVWHWFHGRQTVRADAWVWVIRP